MKKELELYIHIPFCIRKCNYCDFLSFSGPQMIQRRYLSALLSEIEHLKVSAEYQVVSVYIGGGTPSVLPGEWIVQIMERLKKKFSFDPQAEISIEVNPGTVDEQKLFMYRRGGINRLSLGLQSADEEQLGMLGRVHSFQDFENSFAAARRAGFDNINIDLIAGLPEQSLESWDRTLNTAAAFEPEHISAYGLIIEAGTVFAAAELNLPDEETERRMYEDTRAVLSGLGYRQYEISNYARPGYECRHNVGYWKRTDYLGFGIGAASLLNNTRYTNTRDINEYIEGCKEPQRLQQDREVLSKKAQMEEFMFLGLRLTQGFSDYEFEQSFGLPLEQVYGSEIDKLITAGLLQRDRSRISLTEAGINVSNYVFVHFLQEPDAP